MLLPVVVPGKFRVLFDTAASPKPVAPLVLSSVKEEQNPKFQLVGAEAKLGVAVLRGAGDPDA